MVELSTGTLLDELIACRKSFNRRVGIAFYSYKRMTDFAMSLKRHQCAGRVSGTYYRHSMDELFFDSGSSITILNVSDPSNFYGRTFHAVLYDPKITDDMVLEYLKSCEGLSYCFKKKPEPVSRNRADEMEIDAKPLDNFLSQFRVISDHNI